MLDSPYVRRVAICLDTMGIPFEHKAVSVFADFEKFKTINPVVKAPSLICNDGEVLMDSALILEYAAAIASSANSLMPSGLQEKQHALYLLGLALAANEKTVQVLYEKQHRPVEKQHQPWLNRLDYQMVAAFSALENDLSNNALQAGESIASITIAVAWKFNQKINPHGLASADYPALAQLSNCSEKLPVFLRYPLAGSSIKSGK